jgi:excisionase family DNA binding protein
MKPSQDHFEPLALRPAECARALGIDTRTLRRWQRDEGLPFARVGGAVLFPVAELRAWLAQRAESERRTDRLADEILREL